MHVSEFMLFVFKHNFHASLITLWSLSLLFVTPTAHDFSIGPATQQYGLLFLLVLLSVYSFKSV